MCRQRALGLTGRAGRVHDRRIVIRTDLCVRHRNVRQARPRLGRTDQLLERYDARIRLILTATGDDDVLKMRELRQVLANALQLFGIDDGDLRA